MNRVAKTTVPFFVTPIGAQARGFLVKHPIVLMDKRKKTG